MSLFKYIGQLPSFAFLFAIALSTVSCSSVIESSKIAALRANYCAPNMRYADDTTAVKTDSAIAAFSNELTTHDQTLAKHIGLTPLLWQYLKSTTAIEKLTNKQKITDKIFQFTTEMDAVAAELDCNGERFDQIGRFLNTRNAKTNTTLTVASIAAGAAVTFATALIKNENINKGLDIGGGVAGAGLGFMLLKRSGKKIKLTNDRRLLNNVWSESNNDNSFPPALWRVLNERSFSNDGQLSLIQTLKKRWLLLVFDEEMDKKEEELYFGAAGSFHEEDIHHLADMNNQLQASVRTIQQDLRSLISTINRW